MIGAALSASGCASGSAEADPVCGNGLVEGAEQCDDGNPVGGDGCDKACEIEEGFGCDEAEPSRCESICGDGLVVGEETCDGSNLVEKTCESLNLGSGVLRCDDQCQLDPAGCTAYSCGNGQLDPDEACDGADTGAHTCLEQGYDGGSLACRLDCTLDTSGCTLASCGNGIVEGIEGCDDGNTAAGDGCSANCGVEPGWDCDGQPSVCTELCGNGQVDPGEQCDQQALGGQDCTTLGQGYVGGTLACDASCAFDTSGCDLPTCGNGALDAGEQCDGVLLDGESCESLGFLGGTLLCTAACGFDVSHCVPVVCGDGVISSGEACDDGNQQSGDGCNVLCNVESGWACSGEPSSCTRLCGNGALDSGEQCDGALLGGADCGSQGFDAGTLACAADCTYDTSGCRMASCGDGHADAGEDCDGADLGTATCESLGYVSGTLACTANCGYDTAGCVAPVCGDGVISPSAGEQCDDENASSGDGCNAACQVEVGFVCSGEPSVCTPSCGNATWDPGEECDDADLNGGTCVSEGFAGGTLACLSDCTYDTSGCQAAICGNDTRETGEECDGADLGGQDCTDFGFTGGTLACAAGCTYDTSACVNAVCGNGAVETGEQCDDGNTSGGDGCSAGCQWETACSADETLACGDSDHEAWISGNDVNGYSCSGYGSGQDHVYAFTPSSSGNASVNMTCDDFDDDYDVMILEGSCHPELCIHAGTGVGCDDVTFPVTAGLTYYIVVEEWSAFDGFWVSLSCP